jgi:ATP-binding cassette subfamily F protein uup
MSIVNLNALSLHVGGNCLLDSIDWQIQPKDRIALVGRNGAGKSSLLRLLLGEFLPDKGQLQFLSGLKIASLTQEVPISTEESVYHFLVKDLGEAGEVLTTFYTLSETQDLEKLAIYQQKIDNLNLWELLPKIDMMATRLGLNPKETMSNLSGGMKRRALLAAALIAEPDLLLLDEPTNHLDIDTIEWLESYLKTYKGSLLVVTHDREFLEQVANRIVEIDRGKLYSYDCNFETYLERREANTLAEEKQNALFDKRLNQEETWIRTGIKARRTRNEGRVRALKALRETYKARKNKLGSAKGLQLDVTQSGSMVIEAEHIQYKIPSQPTSSPSQSTSSRGLSAGSTVDNKILIKDLSLLLSKGDKLGIIGPNGCGKTTLVRLLLGELEPSSGTVKQGTSLKVAYFDQLRRQLDEKQTVMNNVADGADYVTINGHQKHVASYLKEFLFSPERFNQPVSSLSGGERNRLLLAKLLAKPVNFLVMDEPTNDLDMETLELLENMLVEYTGTLIIISHDRAFINEVVTSVLVWEGEGIFNEYVGGYEDYRKFKQSKKEITNIKPEKKIKSTSKLSFNQQRELELLPSKIETLEKQIAKAHLEMNNAEFYQQTAEQISKFSQELSRNEQALDEMYKRWESLEDN